MKKENLRAKPLAVREVLQTPRQDFWPALLRTYGDPVTSEFDVMPPLGGKEQILCTVSSDPPLWTGDSLSCGEGGANNGSRPRGETKQRLYGYAEPLWP